jgi:alkanesulfonate monooxygenase SsuD/methylene tetrahydromethanopterin reductase-like flavin-dependent oxidoreductase (luciferase family)
MVGDGSGMHFEAFTQLAALSQVTTRARLGQLVTCALYRNVALLAKQAANVDVCSGGRLIFGLGGGWYQREFAAFGYDFPSPGGRFTAFAETIEAVTRLWSEDSVDFDGTFVRLAGASCSPRPASMPPIWTGVHGPRGLEVAARFADVANFNVPIGPFVERSAVLGAACGRVGRSIETSVFRFADLSGGEATARLLSLQGAPPSAIDVMRADHFIGSVDEVTAKVQAFVDAGCRHVVIMALDAETSMDTTERFLREVAPSVVP